MSNDNRYYRIMASVSGGVTGSRSAWLKSNGVIREFESLEDAQKVARELQATTKGRPGVVFHYEAMEHEEL